jgi:hypothetical protein
MQIDDLLNASRATAAFKGDVRAFAGGASAPRIALTRRSPRIKVLRVIAQALAAEPDLEIDRVHIDAWSGCADFRGQVHLHDRVGMRAFDFHWDCHWRALAEGWTDAFGFPDQIRAAKEFSWRCFSVWEERAITSPVRAEAS